jgi:hypothetical protein
MTPSMQFNALRRMAVAFFRPRRLAAMALLFAGATTARAQDAAAGDTRSLVFGVRSASAYEKNPLFVSGGPDDISTQLSGTGAFVMALGRSTLSLGGQADRSFYKRIDQLNRFTYAGDGTGHLALTPRLALQATASYATLVISSSQSGVDQTVVSAPVTPTTITPPVATTNPIAVPSTIYHTLSAAGSAAYALTERTSSQVQVAYNQVRFDTSNVPSGATFSAGGTMQHLYSEHSAVGLVYQFQTNSGVTQAGTIHSLLGSWGRTSERVNLGLQLGVLANATKGQQSWTEPGGGAQLGYKLARGSLDFRYDRSAAQAFGLGRILITDQGSVGLTQTVGKYALHAAGTASRGHDTELKSYHLDMYAAEAGLERPLISTVRLSASVYYRRRSELVSTDDNGVRMLLTYAGHYF